jgi:hypothetical protein
MAIVINGSGTITGVSVGGLPDDIVDAGMMADNSIDSDAYVDASIDNAHLADDAVGVAELSATGTASSSTFLRGDNSWAAAGGDADDYFASSGLSSKDLGNGLHIKTGDSGLGSVNSNFGQLVIEGNTTAGISILTSTTHEGILAFSDSGGHRGLVRYTHSSDKMSFATSDVDRLSIASDGRMTAGDGSFPGGAETLTLRPVTDGGANDYILMLANSTANTAVCMRLYNSNGVVGEVNTSGSGTSYGTSSDYRLKENVDYTWDATTRLKQLKPARFNFIVDDTNTLVDGFIAHEVSSVVPEAISGEKDAMMDEEYEVTPAVMDGEIVVTPAVMGTRSVPKYQNIDQSKLVPLLVKTIQELEARITILENA